MFKHSTGHMKPSRLTSNKTSATIALAFFAIVSFSSDSSFAAKAGKGAAKKTTQKQCQTKKATLPAGTLYTMYRHETAAGGLCIPRTSESPEKVLKRNGIRTIGKPTAAEVKALAKGIGQVERLLGDPIPKSWQQDYQYHSATGKWNQGAHTINVRRPVGSPKGSNVGRLMHELGHKVGNAGVYSQYASYTRGADCKITGYATTKDNEEFAEVFSAYVTYPDLLQQKCPKAFEFMSKRLFPNSKNKIASCKSNKPNFEFDEVDPSSKTAKNSSSKRVADGGGVR